jgi:hypothetical protein
VSIDENGQQWERCNRCCGFTKFEELLYEEPSEEFEYGRDICPKCHFAMKIGGSRRLPKEQWKDQIDPERARELAAEIRKQIDENGLKVTVVNADGMTEDASIPPKKEQ